MATTQRPFRVLIADDEIIADIQLNSSPNCKIQIFGSVERRSGVI